MLKGLAGVQHENRGHFYWDHAASVVRPRLDLGIRSVTRNVLAKKGLNSFKTISRITSDILSKDFVKCLNTGQYLMLCDAFESIKPATKPSSTEGQRGDQQSVATAINTPGHDHSGLSTKAQAARSILDNNGSLSVPDIMALLQSVHDHTGRSIQDVAWPR